jgi:hypothetical protein
MKLVTDVPGSVPEGGAAEEPLAVITAQRYPALAAAMGGADGERVRGELAQLLRGRFRPRAPRRAVTRLARLQFQGEDEVVLLKDISTSGVRLLMERHPSTDLAALTDMVLCVNTDTRMLALPIAFVRMCGAQGKHVDVGFRFLDPGPQHEDVVNNLRNYLFNPKG